MAFSYSPKIITKDLYFMCDPANIKHSGVVQGGGTDVNALFTQRKNAVGTVTGAYDTAGFSADNNGVWTLDGDQCITFPFGTYDFGPVTSGSENFTIETWFNTSDLPASSNYVISNCIFALGGDRNMFVVFGDSLEPTQVSLRLNMNYGGSGFTWYSVGPSPVGSITLNTWFNYVVSYDIGYGFRGYLNGAAVGSTPYTGDISTRAEFTGIGCISDSNSSFRVDRYFQGKISKIAFYTRCLKPTEVLHNYNAIKGRFGL